MRELVEETGYRAAEWARAGILHNAIAYSDRRHRDLVRARPDGRRAPARRRRVPRRAAMASADELEDAARRGELTDAKTLIGLLWLQQLARRPLAACNGSRRRLTPLPIMPAMKVLNLRCASDHRFEGWFASEDDFVVAAASAASSTARCAATRRSVRLPSAPRLNVAPPRGRRRRARAPGDADDAAVAVAARRAPGDERDRGRRRPLRRGGAAHPLRRGRGARHPRPGHRARMPRRCARRASRSSRCRCPMPSRARSSSRGQCAAAGAQVSSSRKRESSRALIRASPRGRRRTRRRRPARCRADRRPASSRARRSRTRPAGRADGGRGGSGPWRGCADVEDQVVAHVVLL